MNHISIVTPSLNQGKYIERTIKSVLNQGMPGLEYVVIDGGSSDNTVEVLKKYKDRLQWISEPDRGQADAINKGIRLTKGDIIGWLNSDDIYYPGALSAVLQAFESDPEAMAVYGDADHIDEQDKIIESYYTEDWDFNRLKDICFLCQPAVFFKRDLTEKYGYLNPELQYCMDYEYWLRAGAIIPFKRIKHKLAGSRMYDENKTLSSRVAVHREINNMLKRTLHKIPDRWIFNYAHAVMDEKGYDRAIHQENRKYVCGLVFISLTASLRWKYHVSFNAIRTFTDWVFGSMMR